MIVQLRLRRGTADEWSAANPVLAEGEPGLDTTGVLLKIGDGILGWNDLPIFANNPETIFALVVEAQAAQAAAEAAATAAQMAADDAAGAVTTETTRATSAEVALQNLTNSTFLTGLSAAFAGSLTATAVKTSAYTAAAGDFIPVDATSGGVTITLPTAPSDRTRVALKKIDSTTNTVTVSRGGSSDVFNKAGGSTSLTLTLTNQAVNLQYSSGIWYVVSDDLPLVGLDARFVPLRTNVPDDNTSAHSGVFGSDAALLFAKGGNTAFGRHALQSGASTTAGSVAFGNGAGELLTSGTNETFIGYAAGILNTTSSHNTYVGSYCAAQATGNYNTAAGSRALNGSNQNVPANTGVQNVAIGYEALVTTGSGSNNTAVGYEAQGGIGPAITVTNVTVSGTTVTVTVADASMIVVGSAILLNGIVGFSSNSPNYSTSAVQPIVTAVSGNDVSFVQSPAPVGTYASGGTLIGGYISGSNNTSVGHYSMFTNQRGGNNVAIGKQTLYTSDNSSNNVAVGYAALTNQTGGSGNNIAVGTNAGFGITTGTQNVFIGKDAGYTATPANTTTTGSGQTVIGYQAGQGSTAQSAHIVAVGSGALVSANYGVALGHSASAGAAGSAAIGTDSSGAGATATTANTIVLGTANHTVQIPGKLLATAGYVAKSAAYTAVLSDGTINCTAGSAFTVTLPTAVGSAGATLIIRKADASANNVTVGTTSAQTINGASTYLLSQQYQTVTVQSDGANWMVI